MAAVEQPQHTIPVIDISTPSDKVAQQVLDAACSHGFLFIKNDGVTVPSEDITDMFTLVCGPDVTAWNNTALTDLVSRLLRLSTRAEIRIHNPLRESWRHQPRLGLNAG